MKRSKAVFSQVFSELVLSEETLEKLHKVLVMMMRDIDTVCRENNIKYFLSAGTLLGAIRHKGFIPWDDDIDIMFFRPDYDIIGKLIEEKYQDKYVIVKARGSKGDATTCMKMYLNGTEYREIISENWPKEQKIFIDFVAIESIKAPKILRKIRGKIYDISAKCSVLALETKYPSTLIAEKAKSCPELKKYVKQRKRLGRIARLLPIKMWYKLANAMIEKYDETSELVHMPTGWSYNYGIIPREVFKDTVEVDFEGLKLTVAQGYDTYLKKFYGSYMEIPPVEKREKHVAAKVDFGKYDPQNIDAEN